MVVISRLVALAGVAFAGWWVWEHYRPTDLGRPVLYQKGTYLGPTDQALAPASTEALIQRAAAQR